MSIIFCSNMQTILQRNLRFIINLPRMWFQILCVQQLDTSN